jgi:EAL domain-containing protein (putative c-di-GMP-specific phosphodiesterase class I)
MPGTTETVQRATPLRASAPSNDTRRPHTDLRTPGGDGNGTPHLQPASFFFADAQRTAEGILVVAREQLEMDVAYITEFAEGRGIFRSIQGDGEGFGLRVDATVPLEGTYARLADGDASQPLPDAPDLSRVIDLTTIQAEGIGTYVGVPITFSSGRVFGALCCASRAANPALEERHVRLMRVLAHLFAQQLEQHDAEWEWRNVLVQRIRSILDAEAVPMAFQPIFDLHNGRAIGVEALARFPSKYLPTPDRWFTEAVEVGLGTDLEILAIRSALASLPALPPGTYLAVNVSPQTLASHRLRRVFDGMRLDRVVLEVTEHAPVDDYPRVIKAFDRLRERGARLAVDDVGAGFASLRHILRLAPDIIKLDIALTRDIDSDPVRRAMTSSLISFAHETRACITAEGIETNAELRTLQGLGVSYGQGFCLARPASLADLPLAG